MNESKWDKRFMQLALNVAEWSKDRSRQVGCVIIGPHREVLSTGYNGFPRGVNDEVEERHQRPAKYMWTEHAECNAIFNAARHGVALDGTTIYLPWYPCVKCARGIAQVGIKFVVAVEPNWDDETYGAEFKVTRELLAEAGVHVRFVEDMAPPVRKALVPMPAVKSPKRGPMVQLAHGRPGWPAHAIMDNPHLTLCAMPTENLIKARGIIEGSEAFLRLAKASDIHTCVHCVAELLKRETQT